MATWRWRQRLSLARGLSGNVGLLTTDFGLLASRTVDNVSILWSHPMGAIFK